MERKNIPICINGKRHYFSLSMWIKKRCNTCEDIERRRTCPHDGGVKTLWAGILGWKNYCDKCGKLLVDHSLVV